MPCFSLGIDDRPFDLSDLCITMGQTIARPIIVWDQRAESLTYTVRLTPVAQPPEVGTVSAGASVTLANTSNCDLAALTSSCVAQTTFCLTEVPLFNLTPGATYLVTLICSEGTEVTLPPEQAFRTIKTWPAQTCTTGVASPGSTTATLTGHVVVGVNESSLPYALYAPRSSANRVRAKFEYGLTHLYGSETPSTDAILATSATEVRSVWSNLDGLSPNTSYHYRVVAYTDEVVVNGADAVFKTSDRPAITGVL